MLPFRGLSVLSVTFVHCAQTTGDDKISFACDSLMSLSDSIKIWLTSVNLFSPHSAPNWSTPCWFERRRCLMANCSRLEILQCNGHNCEPKGNHHHFQMLPSLIPTTSLSPKWGLIGSQMHTLGPSSRRVRGYRGGSPTAVRPSDPAVCGSCPLVTPYYCRLGDLLCFMCVYRFVCALLSLHVCLCCFRCLICIL